MAGGGHQGMISIRLLQPSSSDVKAIMQLHRHAKAAGAPVYGPAQCVAVHAVLQGDPGCVCCCAMAQEEQGDAEQLVGVAVGIQGEVWSGVELVSCVVRADWRGRGGIGRQLVGALLHSQASSLADVGGPSSQAAVSAPAASVVPAAPETSPFTPDAAPDLPQIPVPAAGAERARCWVPPAHPFHGLLCKHYGFQVPHPPHLSQRAETPAYALAGSQLLTKGSKAGSGEVHSVGGISSDVSSSGTSSGSKGSDSEKSSRDQSSGTAHISPDLTLTNKSVPTPTSLRTVHPGLGGVVVRRLEVWDLDAVAALHRDAMYGGKPVFGAQGIPAIQAMLELAAQGSSDLIGLVAVSAAAANEGQILGACTGQQETSEEGGKALVLLTLVVAKQAHRQGLGALLCRACVEVAKQMGIPRVETDVATINTPGVKLFSREGFAPVPQPIGAGGTLSRASASSNSSAGGEKEKNKRGFSGRGSQTISREKGKKARDVSSSRVPQMLASIEMVLDLQASNACGDTSNSVLPSASGQDQTQGKEAGLAMPNSCDAVGSGKSTSSRVHSTGSLRRSSTAANATLLQLRSSAPSTCVRPRTPLIRPFCASHTIVRSTSSTFRAVTPLRLI